MSLLEDKQVIQDDVVQSMQTKFMGIATFTILIWDHLDSFPTEVRHIWQRPKATVSYLFLLNRYITPLGFIVNLFAYFSPTWTPERCRDFIRFEGSMTLIGINVVALMMLLRIRILYFHQPWVPRGLAFVLAVQFSMNAYLLTRGQPVQHDPDSGVRSCTMIFEPSISVAASTSAWLPLLYDTIVFILTTIKTWRSIPWHRRKDHSALATGHLITRKLFEDGLLYFGVIFSVTLVLTIMIVAAPPGLKNITAQLQLIITVTMMSRITLNLKSKHQGNYRDTDVDRPRTRGMKSSQFEMTATNITIPPPTRQTDTWNTTRKWAGPQDTPSEVALGPPLDSTAGSWPRVHAIEHPDRLV